MTAVPVVRQDGEGERLWFTGGGVFTMKASAADTDGAFTLFEDRVERGKATPLHVHPHQDETIYVLAGEIVVSVEGAEHRVGQGGVFVAPRGVPHAFLVTSHTARLLCLQTPGTGEAFYRAASEPSYSDDDVSRPPDLDRLREAAEQSDTIELLGLPPFAAPRERAQAPA
jgi:quercetin dioxygenase-like cupin family protein